MGSSIGRRQLVSFLASAGIGRAAFAFINTDPDVTEESRKVPSLQETLESENIGLLAQKVIESSYGLFRGTQFISGDAAGAVSIGPYQGSSRYAGIQCSRASSNSFRRDHLEIKVYFGLTERQGRTLGEQIRKKDYSGAYQFSSRLRNSDSPGLRILSFVYHKTEGEILPNQAESVGYSAKGLQIEFSSQEFLNLDTEDFKRVNNAYRQVLKAVANALQKGASGIEEQPESPSKAEIFRRNCAEFGLT